MEVRQYHIKPYFGCLSPYIALKNRPYIWQVAPMNRFLKWPVIQMEFQRIMNHQQPPLKRPNPSHLLLGHPQPYLRLAPQCSEFSSLSSTETPPKRSSPHQLRPCGQQLPSGNLTQPLKIAHLQWIFPYNMVIFHSYVKLPEGISPPSTILNGQFGNQGFHCEASLPLALIGLQIRQQLPINSSSDSGVARLKESGLPSAM